MKIIYFLVFFLVVGCAPKAQNDKNIITVSIEPLQFFVDEIGGGDFTTKVLVPKGASAETYEPTPSAIKDVTKSRAFISTALLDTEINVINYLKERENVINHELYKDCDLIEGHHHDCDGHSHSHASHGVDPHVWVSVKNSKKIAKSICDLLISINQDSSKKYNSNCDKMLGKLDVVDSIFKANKGKINTVLVYHPFLAYLGEEYGFEQVAIENEGKEPSAKKIKQLIELAKNEDINTIFYQSQFPVNSVKSISAEISAETTAIDPLEYNHVENLANIAKSIVNE